MNFSIRALAKQRSQSVNLTRSLIYRQQHRNIITLKDHKYTAHASASWAKYDGSVVSDDLKLNIAAPKELGGPGTGKNPEQLLAMGYASCLLDAIQVVGGRMGKGDMSKHAVVHASVHIGEAEEMGGFGIAVDLKVEGVDDELLQAGHKFCPYSRALKHGVIVNVAKA